MSDSSTTPHASAPPGGAAPHGTLRGGEVRVSESRWRAFWNRGGWWKALLVVAVYAVVYQAAPFLFLPFIDKLSDPNVFATPGSVFAGIGLPVVLGALMLLGFAWSLGWLPRPLFSSQPVGRSWWMWLAPVVVLLPVVLRLIGIDYGAYGPAVVAMSFAVGLFIGLSEELLFRGIAVTLLRRGGYSEWVVAAVSSLLFAAMHSVNILTGQPVTTVLGTMGYTLLFGVLMYVVMRVTGNLVWAVLLHGMATDPSTFLATGGIDAHGAGGGAGLTLELAGPATILLLVVALVLLAFIRGRATPRA